MSKKLLMLAGAILLAASPVLAQTNQPATKAPTPTLEKRAGQIIPAEKENQIRAETLLGMKVVNSMGEEVGSVDDIVIDDDGKVSGIVVETGGFMGIGGKAVAISWRAIDNVTRSNVVTIPLSKNDLANAPAFKTKEDISKRMPPAVGLGSASPRPLKPISPERY